MAGTLGSLDEGWVRARLIRNGELVQVHDMTASPFYVEWVDTPPDGRSFYRVMLEGPTGVVIANPVFVHHVPR